MSFRDWVAHLRRLLPGDVEDARPQEAGSLDAEAYRATEARLANALARLEDTQRQVQGYAGVIREYERQLANAEARLADLAREGRVAASSETAQALADEYGMPVQRSLPLERRQIAFMRIPKCGGTALAWYLQEQLGTCRVINNLEALDALGDQVVQSADLVHGYFSFRHMKKFRPDCFALTMVREPVDRIMSFYSNIRTRSTGMERDYPRLVEACKSLSFEQFIEEDDLEVQLWSRNPVTRQLVQGMRSRDDQNDEDLAKQAISNLSLFEFVGLYEDFAGTLNVTQYLLGFPIVDAVERQNVTIDRARRDDLSESVIARVRQLNRADVMLYEHVRSMHAELIRRLRPLIEQRRRLELRWRDGVIDGQKAGSPPMQRIAGLSAAAKRIQADFPRLYAVGNEYFAAGQLADARRAMLHAIGSDPNHAQVVQAILRVEMIDEVLAGRKWYGEQPPTWHPVSLLGAVSQDKQTKPLLHYAMFGKRAYEGFQAGYYLQDLQRLRRWRELVQAPFLLLYLAIDAIAAERVEFIELGSTLYAAYEKFENCRNYLQKDHDGAASNVAAGKIQFIGIEMSEYFRGLAAMLHPGVSIRQYSSHLEVPPPQMPRVVFSLGVANYAFLDTAEFVDWIAQGRVTVVRERFTLDSDHVTNAIGKRFTCFSLPEFRSALGRRGLQVSLLSFAEAQPFLHSDDHNPPNRVFVDAYFAVHNLAPPELAALEEAIGASDWKRLQSNYNTNPGISFGPGMLKGCVVIPDDFPWQRDYVLRASDGRQDEKMQFNFTSSALENGLMEQLQVIDRTYGHIALATAPM